MCFSTVSESCMSLKQLLYQRQYSSYLPGSGDTTITKVVHPGSEGEEQREEGECLCFTLSENSMSLNGILSRRLYNSYLPGRGDTMIMKVVHPGRGSAIALRLC
ncbi:hypothetical protein WMY93_014054 [Mugilogobius chulae]|uniref:Uncharacterized protein n=1 Tax=Mugilogobius chulae TaxID=88201 RepID=A0AAW0NZT6_9GOBI